ncbi:uncharacterized protein LOC126485048 [Schistocerca serialis cubense]|uniref:uncharacterized protein LOC126485048 n=1 Tax=Schistocerca serialis cubense TaxID=2023355 RepID=UPI00214EAE87|nr:uncharacterized protein LOC126485048 [Schistocerca serialis cubense]
MPVPHSQWESLIVIVEKPNEALCIWVDFKHIVNAQSVIDGPLIPKVNDILSHLAGGCIFAKINRKDPCLQIPLDDNFWQLLIINMPFGLFQHNQLHFGDTSVPNIFVEHLTGETSDTASYLDDILVAGEDAQNPDINLVPCSQCSSRSILRATRTNVVLRIK